MASIPDHPSAAEGTPSRGPAPHVQLANPPEPVVRPGAGELEERAQQLAERGIRSGAVDAPGVDATTGDLPGEAVIDADAGIRHAGIPAERAETEATGLALAFEAEEGRHVEPAAGALTTSVEGLDLELEAAQDELDAARKAWRRLRAVLRGRRRSADGTVRPGEQIAPDAKADDLRRQIRRENVLAAIPLVIPLVVEGAVMTFNMHAYLRADDTNWWAPLGMAVIALGIVTFAPYLLGRAINDLTHGKRLHIAETVALAALAVVWVVAAVALALVRVQVDQQGAVAAAEDRRRAAIDLAQQTGGSTGAVPPVVPGDVFDATLPTVVWIVVFLGFGLVLLWWEATHRNPVRVAEAKARLRVIGAAEPVALLTAKRAEVLRSVTLQRETNALALAMRDAEHGVVDAVAASARAVYHAALGEAAGDPSMPPAIERHKAARAARAADATADGER